MAKKEKAVKGIPVIPIEVWKNMPFEARMQKHLDQYAVLIGDALFIPGELYPYER